MLLQNKLTHSHETSRKFRAEQYCPRTSWVVSKSTGLPTGTKPEDYPPDLLQTPHVIDTTEDLRNWLLEHH